MTRSQSGCRAAALAVFVTLVVTLVVTLAPVPARAAAVPSGFTDTQLVSGLNAPTAMAFAPDGRLFVCEQGGTLRVIKGGTLLATPFVTVSVDSSGERGLLGVAFDPAFTANHFVYLYYTTLASPVHNRISRFTANGDVAVPGSEVVLLDLDNLSSATNHNGGAIHFGPDGRLYAGVGENANGSNSQTLANLLGKILRINADGSIPTDNPFYTTASGKNRAIWALGLRNPFTFAFSHTTGRMFLDDVGAGTWEEIDDGIAGSNYGWPQVEGPQPPGVPGVRYPLYWYGHTGGACAIAGGAFYDSAVQQFPAQYAGSYFFGDLCAGWIHRLDPTTLAESDFATGISNPVDLHLGADGALYYLARGTGSVGRITSDTGPPVRTEPVWQDFFAVNPLETPMVGDFDGDGRTDIVTFTRQNPLAVGNVYVALSDGSRFGPATQWNDWFAVSTDQQVVIGDFNGDGKDDIATWLATTTRQVYVALSNGSAFVNTAVWAGSIGFAPTDVLAAGDVNGDGKDDLVLFARTQGKVYVALSTGSGFAAPQLWHGFFAVSTYERPRVADVNGDGRADIVTFCTNSPTAFGDVYVALSDGSRFVDQNGVANSSTKWHDWFAIDPAQQVRTGDLNGDHKADFFTFLPLPWGQAYTVTSTGTSMGPNVLWPERIIADPRDVPWVGDVNRDGKADVVIFAQGEGKVYVSLGR